jgi:hypothetical protein
MAVIDMRPATSCQSKWPDTNQALPVLCCHHLVLPLKRDTERSHEVVIAIPIHMFVLISRMRLSRQFVMVLSVGFAPDSHVFTAFLPFLRSSRIFALQLPVSL